MQSLAQNSLDNAPAAPKPRVQDLIRQDIISGKLPSGTRLTEVALASEYEISRIPVREALRALEIEGFVESKPYAGSTVSRIPFDDAEDLFNIRDFIESATAKRAAKEAARQFASGEPNPHWWAVRKDLAEILDLGDAAVAAHELHRLPALNMAFHLGIAELSGSQSLQAFLKQIAYKIEWLYAADVGARGKESWAEHREIMAAIDAAQLAESSNLMSKHVVQSRDGFLSRYASQ